MQEIVFPELRHNSTEYVVLLVDPKAEDPAADELSRLEFPDETQARAAFDLMRGRRYNGHRPILLRRREEHRRMDDLLTFNEIT